MPKKTTIEEVHLSLGLLPNNPQMTSYFDFLYYGENKITEHISLMEFLEWLENFDFFCEDEIFSYIWFYNLLFFKETIPALLSVYLADEFDKNDFEQFDFWSEYFLNIIENYFVKNVFVK